MCCFNTASQGVHYTWLNLHFSSSECKKRHIPSAKAIMLPLSSRSGLKLACKNVL